jgi:hypothetical protein
LKDEKKNKGNKDAKKSDGKSTEVDWYKGKDEPPKKPTNAYTLYANEKRPDLQKSHPDVDFGGISKLIGDQWNALSDELKKPYNDANEAQKKKYNEVRIFISIY